MDHSGLALVLSGSIYIVVVGIASASNKPLAPHAYQALTLSIELNYSTMQECTKLVPLCL